jgi:hypothetical protein
MTIHADALVNIMSVLTDLYSDPILAVIREYSTNAFDAHREAGVTRPIEVSTPTELSPFFRVRDYGEGLDDEDIREIYSRYGASTKRESNDVVGMLGLGCKSALTYTDQFTVVGIKDGICTQVSVSRDEDGTGSMTIVNQYETDEPSGVEIVVPVKKDDYSGYYGDKFESKADTFFSFWNKDSVLLNGKEPRDIEGIWIADDLLLSTTLSENYVVMGNVAYPMPASSYKCRTHAVAYVNIGDVDFTPSREALQMTARTKEVLATIDQRVKDETVASFDKQINGASNHKEALEKYFMAKTMGFNAMPTYKGTNIPLIVTAKADNHFLVAQGIKAHYRRGWDYETSLSASSWNKSVWITDYDGSNLTPTRRKRLDFFRDEVAKLNMSGSRNFIFVQSLPTELADWVDSANVFSWDDIKEIKLPREATATINRTRMGHPTGSYFAFVGHNHRARITAGEIDTSKPVFYYDNANYFNSNNLEALRAVYGNDFTVVLMGKNRVVKFKRDFPMAVEAYEGTRVAAKNWLDKLNADELLTLRYKQHSGRYSSSIENWGLDVTQIDDPNLVAYLTAMKADKTTALAGWNQILPFLYGDDRIKTAPEDPAKPYVLLSSLYPNAKQTDHVYLYINTVWAAAQN